MKKLAIFILSVLLFGQTNAQWYKKVVKVLGAPIKVAVDVAKAPTETVVKAAGVAVGVNKPSDILEPYKNLAKTGGEVLSKAKPIQDFINKPQELLYTKAQEYSKKVGGKTGEFIFDVGTFTQRFYNQLAPSSTEALALALKGENPLVIVAAPLAAAIHSAKEKHSVSAKPLPDEVKNGLKDFFSAELLENARYTVGSVDITLPNFIGQGKKFMGDHYAVVVENIIVFNRTPPSYRESAWWWGHEVTHTQQYASLGVEVFSYKFLKDFGKGIEGEADAMGDKVYAGQTGTRTLTPLAKIFKPQRELYRGQELIISQCKFDNDDAPASYVVTNKGKILAVNPLNGQYIHVGYTKPPLYAGTEWTFSTSKTSFSVLANGEIVSHVAVKNPSGKIIGYQALKIGQVIKYE